MKEIDEEFKAAEGGQLLLKGGSLPVPVVDYIKEKYQLLFKGYNLFDKISYDIHWPFYQKN